MAEEVKDKTRTNFCDWFQVANNTFAPTPAANSRARSALDGLFGDTKAGTEKSDVKSDLDRLFGD